MIWQTNTQQNDEPPTRPSAGITWLIDLGDHL